MKILRYHAKDMEPTVFDGVIAVRAMYVQNDIRKTMGCLKKDLVYAEHAEVEVTVDSVMEKLSYLGVDVAA